MISTRPWLPPPLIEIAGAEKQTHNWNAWNHDLKKWCLHIHQLLWGFFKYKYLKKMCSNIFLIFHCFALYLLQTFYCTIKHIENQFFEKGNQSHIISISIVPLSKIETSKLYNSTFSLKKNTWIIITEHRGSSTAKVGLPQFSGPSGAVLYSAFFPCTIKTRDPGDFTGRVVSSIRYAPLEAQLSAGHICGLVRPGVITDVSPHLLVKDF